ncbi:hypothetical protein SVIOM342S_00148 [Streptomyces violaceorubidus]
MDLALLRTFVTVHRAGSFTRAAALLGLSQPAVTGLAQSRPCSATAEALPAILRLDEDAFGADRTHIVTRPPAFAAQLRGAEADCPISGYAAAWPNMDTHVLGPLTARDTDTAKALLGSLATLTDRPPRTDTDVRHE